MIQYVHLLVEKYLNPHPHLYLCKVTLIVVVYPEPFLVFIKFLKEINHYSNKKK